MNRNSISRLRVLLSAVVVSFGLVGCATTGQVANRPAEIPAMHTVAEVTGAPIARVDDPWERFNRSMYKFNYHFDKYVFLPVVGGYEFITPTVVQTGVSNFFQNLGEIGTFYNSVFQLKGQKALTTAGRFATNTTIGIGGLFDPASSFGMSKQDEDFGQTLAVWGAGTGPYVVLPVLGPNTVRSATGVLVDGTVRNNMVDSATDLTVGEQNSLNVMDAIDTRHNQPFRYYQSGYPFEYYVVRFLYREKRELAAMK